MQFRLEHKDPGSKARSGTIQTAHGEIQTPIFMPVGTVASVKAVHQRELAEELGVRQGTVAEHLQCAESTIIMSWSEQS